MKQVELYGRVRYAVKIQGMSRREAARVFGVDRRTVDKMLAFPTPPGYRRKKAPARPKLDPFVGIIDQILEDDTKRLKKQRHTSKRIFERLRDEYGFTGGITIVKDYVFAARQRQREMFVPLTHPAGHAQADFGEADVVVGGTQYRAHYFVMSLPHSDACFVSAYRNNDYSVPVAFGHQEVWIRGYVHEVIIGCGSEEIARHPRSYDREDLIFNPIHYLPLLEKKVGALDQATPLVGWDLP
jgi:hypothetical protein